MPVSAWSTPPTSICPRALSHTSLRSTGTLPETVHGGGTRSFVQYHTKYIVVAFMPYLVSNVRRFGRIYTVKCLR
jgi:hypothetical protein